MAKKYANYIVYETFGRFAIRHVGSGERYPVSAFQADYATREEAEADLRAVRSGKRAKGKRVAVGIDVIK